MRKSYIRGKRNRACCDLIDHLSEKGIRASVAHESRGNTLYVYCHRKDQMKLVPSKFGEWDVIVKLSSERNV